MRKNKEGRTKTIKEEFFSSLIFVSKWLVLGLGIIGLIYFAISLAYKKIYYEPRVEKYNIEIAKLENQKSQLTRKLKTWEDNKKEAENEIPEAKQNFQKSEQALEKLNEQKSLIERGMDFMNLSDKESQEIEYEKNKQKLENLEDDLKVAEEKIEELNEDIQEISEDIEEEEENKAKVGTGVINAILTGLGLNAIF